MFKSKVDRYKGENYEFLTHRFVSLETLEILSYQMFIVYCCVLVPCPHLEFLPYCQNVAVQSDSQNKSYRLDIYRYKSAAIINRKSCSELLWVYYLNSGFTCVNHRS